MPNPTEDRLRERLADQREAEFIERLEASIAAGGGFVASFDSTMATFLAENRLSDDPDDRRFAWRGAHWIVERIAPAPCGCEGVRVGFIRKLGSKMTTYVGVRCPTGLHQDTFTVELKGQP